MANIKQIGDIQIFAQIHQGATTQVYKGYQASLDRFVLLKVLNPELSSHPEVSRQFEEEARLIAKVQDPNVVTIFDYGAHEGLRYFATEFIEGCTLEDLIHQNALPAELAWYILREACLGLKAAHDKSLLHRDIKPSNILISQEGLVKITDFGMAETIRSEEGQGEEIKGTVAYFSPEQILGEKFDVYSDIFSLGVTFFEMLSGLTAFKRDSISDSFNSILKDDPTELLQHRRDLPAPLVSICQKMLEKTPENRYQTCAALLHELNAFQLQQNFSVATKSLEKYLSDPDAYVPKVSPEIVATTEVKKSSFAKYLYLSVPVLAVLFWSYFALNSNNMQQSEAESTPVFGIADSIQTETQPIENSVKKKNIDGLQITKKIKTHSQDSLQAMNRSGDKFVTKSRPKASETQDLVDVANTTSVARFSVKPGTLNIHCSPWAFVFVDGDSVGSISSEMIHLSQGEHEVLFRNPDFPSEHKVVLNIQSEQVEEIQFSFWTTVGTLSLMVSPFAEVYVDGQYKDTVPPQNHPFILVPGNHRLTLKNPQLGDWQTNVDISAGEKKVLKFNLTNLLAK